MSTDAPSSTYTNLARLLEELGDIPPERVLIPPPPGTATEQDVLAARASPERRLCELVDGVLVEKAMGSREALLALELGRLLGNFVAEHDLGAVLGADGMLRLMPGLVRIPDLSFIPWRSIPGEEFGAAPIASYVPDLAVEVLSEGNRPAEIRRKLVEYFLAGTRLAWLIDPKKQTARIYTSPEDSRRIGKTGSLDGGEVLPGFTLALADLFACTRPRRKRSP